MCLEDTVNRIKIEMNAGIVSSIQHSFFTSVVKKSTSVKILAAVGNTVSSKF